MSHIKDRLTYYNDFMKKLADYHQMIPASDGTVGGSRGNHLRHVR